MFSIAHYYDHMSLMVIESKDHNLFIIDGEPEWKIETILHHHRRRGVQQYLVKYIGYDYSKAMWLDEYDLVNAPDILQAYKQQIV